uniref:Uncharacterized protein n=1 Tax=Anguilla anguilla TaxID=7936 RepID=A0A0E9PN54_ANGAN
MMLTKHCVAIYPINNGLCCYPFDCTSN